jgi:GNAT superfamily N-acetyltransferase
MTNVPTASPYRIRAITDADRAALTRFYGGLSAESFEARFHGAAAGIGVPVARYLCGPDHDHREGIVAETTEADGGVVIIGHVCIEPSCPDSAEMAIAVADAWRRRGVGRAMLAEAILWARGHGLTKLVASMRWGNDAILGLIESAGCPVTFGDSDGGVVDAIVDLSKPGMPVPVPVPHSPERS